MGSPSCFILQQYPVANIFGSSLGSLSGSAAPVTADVYIYTPASDLTLSPGTTYFIVLTAGTAVANGTFEWSVTKRGSYNPIDGWHAPVGIATIDTYQSSDGSHWNRYFGGYILNLP